MTRYFNGIFACIAMRSTKNRNQNFIYNVSLFVFNVTKDNALSSYFFEFFTRSSFKTFCNIINSIFSRDTNYPNSSTLSGGKCTYSVVIVHFIYLKIRTILSVLFVQIRNKPLIKKMIPFLYLLCVLV